MHARMRARSEAWFRPRQLALVMMASVLSLLACSSDSEPGALISGDIKSGVVSGVRAPCVEGTARSCTVTLGQQGDVLNCLRGTQTCTNGEYGECIGGEQFTLSASGSTTLAASRSMLSLSSPVNCASNLCDPNCRVFTEVPGAPVQPLPGMVATMPVVGLSGSILEYTGNLPGRKSPCKVESDCQYGQKCDDRFQACVPRVQGEAKAGCATIDLTAEPGCQNDTQPGVTVCNRGMAEAPAGVQVAHLAASQFGSTMPDLTGAAYCTVAQPIAAGTCAWVPCPGLTAGREVMVNPPGAMALAECDGTNNWGLYQATACQPVLCKAGYSTGRHHSCAIPLNDSVQPVELLGLWHFDEPMGYFIDDSSGRGNRGVLRNTATNAVRPAGKVGRAGRMVRENRYADMGLIDFGAFSGLSVALWLRYDEPNNANQAGGLVSFVHTQHRQGWELLKTNENPPRLMARLFAPGGNTLVSFAAPAAAAFDETWHHAAFTWNGASGEVRLYLDGELLTTDTHAFPILNPIPSWTPLLIGRTLDDDDFGNWWNQTFAGDLDEVSIYRGVLSPEQVRVLAQTDTAAAGTPTYARVRYTPRPRRASWCNQADPALTSASEPPPEVAFGNKCYFIGEDTSIFSQANALCANYGADLTSHNRPEERLFQKTVWEDVESGASWLGLRNDNIAGDPTWSQATWTDGSCRAWSPAPWADAQPDNGNGDEYCAYISSALSGDQWRDVSCSGAPAPTTVCERVPDNNGRGGCAAGQWSGPDGTCYELVTAALTYAAAENDCAQRGKGWRLATITSLAENDFAAGMLNCNEAWIGRPAGFTAAFVPGEPNGAAGVSDCPRTNSIGRWVDDTCATARSYLCEGPPPAAAPEDLVLVSGPAACTANNQYYLDNPLNPSFMVLCPAACSRVQGTPGEVEYEFSCDATPPPPPPTPNVFTQVYTSDCGQGLHPQWSFLRYASTTPGDSNILFEARTAPTADALPDSNYKTVATARSTPTDTQNCTDACDDFDLFQILGAPDNRGAVLQLKVSVNPGSAGQLSSLTNWQVTFSCQAAE